MGSEGRDRLPEGAEFAHAVDALFRSGEFDKVMKSIPPQPDFPAEDETLRQTLNGHIEAFCQGISEDAARKADRRQAANEVRWYFDSWKQTAVRYLEKRSAPASEISAVQDLTLRRVAEYANQQFQESSRDAATLEPGSPAQELARRSSDRWSIMEEIITPAADPDQSF